jgi:hypothetical protein
MYPEWNDGVLRQCWYVHSQLSQQVCHQWWSQLSENTKIDHQNLTSTKTIRTIRGDAAKGTRDMQTVSKTLNITLQNVKYGSSRYMR